ncbi:MAG: NUDIX hydrolase [Candidatus Hodarchaeota archaeon]
MPNLPRCLQNFSLIIQSHSRLILDLPEGFQRAAVMIPLIQREKEWHLIFTRRTDQVSHHKNEISFPGGRVDDQDRDLIHTAEREAYEELGLKNIQILGLIDDIPTISKYIVTPVVGYIEDIGEIKHGQVNTPEIAYTLEASLSYLAIPDIFSVKEVPYKGDLIFKVPFFDYRGEIIWGATGRILVNLFKKFNLLKPDCRRQLMEQDLWKDEYESTSDLETNLDLTFLN